MLKWMSIFWFDLFQNVKSKKPNFMALVACKILQDSFKQTYVIKVSFL